MKKWFLVFAFVVAITVGYAVLATAPALAGDAGLIGPDSALYLWTKLDHIQQGCTFPTNTFPLTSREFSLTVQGEEHEDEMTLSLETRNEFVLSVQPLFSGFFTPYADPYPRNTPRGVPTDIIYLYEKVPTMLELGDEFSLGGWMNARIVLEHIPGIRYMYGSDYFAPWDIDTVFPEMNFPKEGYVTWAVPHTSLTVGRLKTGIGNGYFGNTFLNGKAPFYDQIQATYYTERFKFFYMLGSSQTFLTAEEKAAQTNWGPAPDEAMKTFSYHRVELHPADWVTVGLGEMDIIGGKSPDLYHILPFTIWHNAYSHYWSNVMAMIDVSLVPIKGLQVYGEFTVDDFRIPGVEDPNSKPPAYAYQAGAQYVLPFSGETRHAIGVEFTHVDPWTYNRWQPYLTMYQRQIRNQDLYLDICLGYPYGGDLNHYGLYYVAVHKNGTQWQASYSHLDKGEIELGLDEAGQPYYVHYPEVPTGPSGIVERRDTIDLELTRPLPWDLSLRLVGSFSWIRNFQHQDGATETLGMFLAGVRWSY